MPVDSGVHQPPAPPGFPAPVPSAAPQLAVIDYPVMYVPQAAAAAVAAAKRNRWGRIISLLISVAILAALYFFFRSQLGGISWQWLAIGLALPLAYLAWAIVREVAVRREVSRVGDGLALGITRQGLLLPEGWLPWEGVATLKARPGRLGRSPALVVTAVDEKTSSLPLPFLSALPATLDNAIAALSGERFRVDFSKLGA